MSLRFTCLIFLLCASSHAWALTIAEALGTPGREWVASSEVTTSPDPGLSHDGAGVVSIPIGEAVGNSISTEMTVPSLVRYWLRAGGLHNPTTVVAGSNATVVSDWMEIRQVVLPGEYRILNDGMPLTKGPLLFVDEFSATPLPVVSLSEALDAPGITVISDDGQAVGLVDPLTAPDGEDAVYIMPQGISGLLVDATGPAILVCRYAQEPPPDNSPPVFGQWVENGFAYIAVGGGAQTVPIRATARSGVNLPIRIDQLQILPLIPASTALDAPGFTFTLTHGPDSASLHTMPSPSAPAGAEGGNAVLMESPSTASAAVTTRFSGPGLLLFRWLGDVRVTVNGLASTLKTPPESDWASHQIFLPVGSHEVTWSGSDFSRAWLDAVHFEPSPSRFVSDLLGSPETPVSFTATAIITPVPSVAGIPGPQQAMTSAWRGPPPADAAMVIHCEGPTVFTMAASSVVTAGAANNISVDGGPALGWPGSFGHSSPQSAFVIPSAGPHTVRIARDGTFAQLGTTPLTTVPLAEAADAPDLVFRTSTATPWLGLKTPPSLNREGNDAVCGGEHSIDGDPWIETDVTGPGLLSFRMELGAQTNGAGNEQNALSLDGVTVPAPPPAGTQRQRLLAVPAGTHTVRWTQRGSRALTAAGSVLWLDAVTFAPATPLPLNDAIETTGRTWTTSGPATLTSLATPTAPDGVDAAFFTTNEAWIETTLSLPCQIEALGTGFVLKSGQGTTFTPSGSPSVWQLDGTGVTTLRISRLPDAGISILDQLQIYEFTSGGSVNEVMGVPGVIWHSSGPKEWTFLRNRATGVLRMQLSGLARGASMWLESVIPGPFRLHPNVLSTPKMAPVVSLPGQNGTVLALPAFVSSPGPHRIRLRFGSAAEPAPAVFTVTSAGWKPGLPAGSQSGAPGLAWTTGGDAPWMDSAEGLTGSISGLIGTGQSSWLETETTTSTPALVSWRLSRSSNTSGTGGAIEAFVNGLPLPVTGHTWLHLPAGTHRLRWAAFGPPVGSTTFPQEPVRMGVLSDLVVTPKPTGSIQEILGSPQLIFVQNAVAGLPGTSPLRAWPDGSLWQPATDPATGHTAVKTTGSPTADKSPLYVLRPSPGLVRSVMLAHQFESVERFNAEFPVTALPFPWTTARSAPIHTGSESWYIKAGPKAADFWVDDVAFTAFQPVGLGEALEQPALAWSSGGPRPGVMAGWSGSSPGTDAVICHGLQPHEIAWIEAPITGPTLVTWQRTDALRLDVLVDGQSALRFKGRPGAPGPNPSLERLSLGNGTHLVRWQFSRETTTGDASASLHTITLTPSSPSPDVAALVDQPGLSWLITPATARVSTAITHDGVDALEIVPMPVAPPDIARDYTVATEVTGPGVFRCWFRGATASLRTSSDDTLLFAAAPARDAWKEFVVPVPEGRCRFSLVGAGSAWLDEVSWTPAPSVSLANALDVTNPVTLTQENGAVPGAAAWAPYAEDGVDSILLLPGTAHRLHVNAPMGSTLSLRARSLLSEDSVIIGVEEKRSTLKATTWTEVKFLVTVGPDAGDVVIRGSSSGGPILLDRLIVTPAAPGPYEIWAAANGLTGHPHSAPGDDADGDGLNNLVEFAFGSPPLNPSQTGTSAGLPIVQLVPRADQAPALAIEFDTVPGVKYEVTTQSPETADVWSVVHTFIPTTAGRHRWESPAGVDASSHLLVRVRVSLR